MKLERGLYLAVNKDTDEGVCRAGFHFDSKKFKALEIRAERIISSNDVERCASRSEGLQVQVLLRALDLLGRDGQDASSSTRRVRLTAVHAAMPTANMQGEGARWDCGKGIDHDDREAMQLQVPHCAAVVYSPQRPDSSDGENVIYMIDGRPFTKRPRAGKARSPRKNSAAMTPETVTDPNVQGGEKAFGGAIDYIDTLNPARAVFGKGLRGSCGRGWGVSSRVERRWILGDALKVKDEDIKAYTRGIRGRRWRTTGSTTGSSSLRSAKRATWPTY